MIHYHGLPITPMDAFKAAITGRHAMVSFATRGPLKNAAEIAQSFALDNGAFSHWKRGKKPDWPAYYAWVQEWMTHPGFDWAVIPDVIDGGEDQNDREIENWPFGDACGVPVWHLHESLDRLHRLVWDFPRVAFGSSGEYRDPGSDRWWSRISEAMEVAADERGRARTKLHGLRMLDSTILSHTPFSSADSTNVGQNVNLDSRWKKGAYQPCSKKMRALILIDRIENHATAARWTGSSGVQKNLDLCG